MREKFTHTSKCCYLRVLYLYPTCFSKEPQWERTTRIIKCTFDRFLTGGGISDEEWLYFDYKYLNENLFTCEELRKVITHQNYYLITNPTISFYFSTSHGIHLVILN